MSVILDHLTAAEHSDLLVGYETADDAAVYRLDGERALVCTADFITPVVDDGRTFGRVAAANSLSDVYAMGGTPLVALNLLGFPPAGVPNEILGEILAGSAEMCAQAGCAVGGGHSVRDDEVKFGLSVTGLVHPGRVMRNSTAKPGDQLILTKPLGTGALVAAGRKGRLDDDGYAALIACMTMLNRCGCELFALGATAATDVTGFGLTGHALEMARGSQVTLAIDTSALPLLPEAVALCAEGFTCGGTQANAQHSEGKIRYAPKMGQDMVGLVHDPQTSGGLLVSVPADRAAELTAGVLATDALCAAVIGEVRAHQPGEPWLDLIA